MNAITKFRTLSFMFLTAGAFTFLNAGITTTLHNLSATGTGTIKADATEMNDELCSYCHTPHGASSSFAGAPLWNKGTMTTTGFTMYGAAGVDLAGSTIAGTNTDQYVNSQSLACLSCHDGVSGINSIVNAPGSGGYVAAGAYVDFGATAAGTAKTMPAGITQIGKDLSNDHPVSITYTVGAASLVATTTALTGWVGASTVADLLRGAASNKVECGSCHDPHTSDNATFLRKANTGSALCLGCHNK
ncbi:MAG: hypothetical protein QG567_565 [Campylobacterota bacterium]|nr:hypothetical protein [Campylobacterota bacterium]